MIVRKDPKIFYFYFDWPKDVDKNLKHEIEFIIKSNESLAEKKKTRLNNYCPYVNTKTIFMNTENSEINEPRKFVLNLPQRLDFEQTCCSSKLMYLFQVEKYKKTV